MNPAQTLRNTLDIEQKALADLNLPSTLDAISQGRRTFGDVFSAQHWIVGLGFVPVISSSPLDVFGTRFGYAGVIWGEDTTKDVAAQIFAAHDLPLDDIAAKRAKIFGARSSVADFGRPMKSSASDKKAAQKVDWKTGEGWKKLPDDKKAQIADALVKLNKPAKETPKTSEHHAGDKPGHEFHGNQWTKKAVSAIGKDEHIPAKAEVTYNGKTYIAAPNSTHEHAKLFSQKELAIAHANLLNASHPDNKTNIPIPVKQKNQYIVGHEPAPTTKVITNKIVNNQPPLEVGEETPVVAPPAPSYGKSPSNEKIPTVAELDMTKDIPPFTKVKHDGKLVSLSPNSTQERAKLFHTAEQAQERAKLQDAKSGSGSKHVVVPIPQKNMFAVGRIVPSWTPEAHPANAYQSLGEKFEGKKLSPPVGDQTKKLDLTGTTDAEAHTKIGKYVQEEPKKKPAPPPPHEPHFEPPAQPLAGSELTQKLGELPEEPHGAAPAQEYNPKDFSDIADGAAAKLGIKRIDVLKALSNHADPSKDYSQKVRAAVESYILKEGKARKNAVLLVRASDNPEERAQLIKTLTTGPAQHRALDEYADTPIYDLQCLGGISVINDIVHGQSTCKTGIRKVYFGSTSVTGDFRHELGHAIHSALSGGAGIILQTPLTKVIYDHYQSVIAKVKANPEGNVSPYIPGVPGHGAKMSHQWYEDNYGIMGSRALDNWKEDFAEHYRGYMKAVYQDEHATMYHGFVEDYRKHHLAMAKLFDAHYTAAIIGNLYKMGQLS